MPQRNAHIILLAMILSFGCVFVCNRIRASLMVGEAVELIESAYVDRIDTGELVNAAMEGMVDQLDEHSQFFPPDDKQELDEFIHQQFAGIGIRVHQRNPDAPVRVIAPIVDSPAIEAGLRPGDLIVAVADVEKELVDTRTMNIRDVSKLLRGPVGTAVRVRVVRGIPDPHSPINVVPPEGDPSGDEPPNAEEQPNADVNLDAPPRDPTEDPSGSSSNGPADDAGGADGQTVRLQFPVFDLDDGRSLEFTLSRRSIRLDSVVGDYRDQQNHWVFALRQHPDIGYVRVRSFAERTATEVRDALLQIRKMQCRGTIIDLRGNSGGLLDAATRICDMFVEKGTIVSTKTRFRRDVTQATAGTQIEPGFPMVVL
ncbi:MAG: S41 family peptidase, partial [Planctomycetota bacterium]